MTLDKATVLNFRKDEEDFWEAEPEHQDYLQRNPGGYTCHFVRPGWKLPARAAKAVNS
jgi:peptide methionine sulfoxide reductase MsrA